MWWEEKGEAVVKKTVATAPNVRDGIDQLLAYLAKRHPHQVWAKMAELDYEGEAGLIREWFARQLPQARPVEVFWFAFWDVTEGFDLRGASQWSRDPEDWEWWYHDDFHGDSFESGILEKMHRLAESVDDPTKPRRKEGAVWDLTEYLLTIGYVGLVAAQIFRETDPRELLDGHDERWVVTGFPDAVYGMIVGKVTLKGFAPFNQSN